MLHLIENNQILHKRLAADLAEIESRFSAELISDLSSINELVRHIEQYRGKMFRPTLLLLTGYALSDDQRITDEHLTLATVVEMIHMASLIHDDVLDDSEIRRNGQTINFLRGNETAVMLGDYLFSHAYRLCSSLNSQAASRLIAQATNRVCEGEMLQLFNRDNWSLDEQTYFDIISRKTGELTSVSCRLGALFANATQDQTNAITRFGQLLGSAFQITDDVLDLIGDPAIVGKSLGKDLEKGKLTLPLIHRLETAHAPQRQQLLTLLRTNLIDRHACVAQLLIESDSVTYAHHRAKQMIDQALDIIANLPPTPARDALQTLAATIVNRNS